MGAELLDGQHYLKMFIGLLAMVDPPSSALAFLSVAGGLGHAAQKKVAALSVIVMLAVFYLFMVFGTQVLDFFGISLGAFKVMGGLVLGLLGFEMIRENAEDVAGSMAGKAADGQAGKSWVGIAVMPLAMPLLAGPGALSTVILFSGEHDESGHLAVVSLVILAIGVMTWVSFQFANAVSRVMGPTGIVVFNKIMGMLIVAIAVEFVFDGTAMHFPQLVTTHGV